MSHTVRAGLFAGSILAAIYVMLTYMGMCSSGVYTIQENGAWTLRCIVSQQLDDSMEEVIFPDVAHGEYGIFWIVYKIVFLELLIFAYSGYKIFLYERKERRPGLRKQIEEMLGDLSSRETGRIFQGRHHTPNPK